jgi:hypothetical protein
MASVSSLFRSGLRIRDEFGISLSPPYRERLDQVGLNGLERRRSFRAHRVGVEEFLEEWYDRSAESCNLFDNISVTCTVCRHFEKECCSPDAKGPTILSLLKASYMHDSLHRQ